MHIRIFQHTQNPMRPRLLSPALLALFLSTVHLLAAERIVLVAGGGSNPPEGVPARDVELKEPFGTEFGPNGDMFIVEMARGNRLLKVDARGMTSWVAGTGVSGSEGVGGSPRQVAFNGPHNLAITKSGAILIGDTWNGRVVRLDLAAGTSALQAGFLTPADKARGAGPYCISLNPAGTHLYIADLRHIHEVKLASGKARVVAGNGQKRMPEDGAMAVDAPLVDPRAVAVDSKGNIYILERGGHALRVVDASGRIRTVVNRSGKKGATGDGGPAIEATMNGPKHLCIAPDDSVIIADAENHIIRRYQPKDGTIQRVAGTGTKGTKGLNGPPDQCELARPHGVTYGPDGRLYITDSYNDRILRIEK